MTISKKRAKSQAAARKKEYTTKLKALREVGAYSPKGTEITPYRIGRINKAWAKNEQYLSAQGREKFFYVPATSLTKKDRAQFLGNAKSLDMPTTPKGVFIQKEGQRKAALRYNKENQEYDILLTGKVRWGENKGKKISDRLPIGSYDRVTGEFERIRNVANQFGDLKPNEQLSFVIIEHGEEVGATRETFHSVDALVKYIDRKYHPNNKAARLRFLRMVAVRKTTLVAWDAEHPPRPRKMARRGKKPLGYRPK